MALSLIQAAGQKRIVMVIRKLTLLFVLGAMVCSSTAALAFDPDKELGQSAGPRVILRYGYNALKDGRHDDAIEAFRFGAVKNHLPSQWKLARMYQSGQGVPQDPLAAYELFETIADRFAEIPPNRIDITYVSHSVVSLGLYSLTGIEGTRVRSDPHLAEHHFYRAAALYGDAEGQYQLGKLYNSKLLGVRRPRNAARWFRLASKKRHSKAEAELGEMLFYGNGVRQNRVRGLVYLTRAAAGSARGGFHRIREKRRTAIRAASGAQRIAAQKIIATLNLFPKRKSKSGPPVGVYGFNAKASEIQSGKTCINC